MTTRQAKLDDQTANLLAVCQPEGNPVAWYRLLKSGLTVEALRKASRGPHWEGPKPDFSSVPKGEMLDAIKAAEGDA